jgi:glycine/D-amino acid oxidase-like deaminating enzyme
LWTTVAASPSATREIARIEKPTVETTPAQEWDGRLVLAPGHGLPVFADVDVTVVGGGAAGVAAAATAARHGRSTLLIERYGFCGGAAVGGMSGTICGMYLASDAPRNRPEQTVFGFTETFRAAMEAKSGITAPLRYGKTWTVTHDPLVWREVADALLDGNGARVLFHAFVVGVVMADDAVCGVVVETKAGRAVVHARIVVDASGDADVVYRAGLGFTMGQDGVVQNPTMIFRLGNVDVRRFLDYWGPDTICSAEVSRLLIEANASGRYHLPRAKIWVFPTPRPNELLVNATRLLGGDGRPLNAANPLDLTEAELKGRRQVRDYWRFLKDHVPGCEASFVNDTGVQVGVRQTRSIVGVERLGNADVTARRKRADGIARSPWPIELHVGDKPKLEWLIDDYYEVPFAALLPARGENLVVAGRCFSAEHEALASARVTAQCFAYGHAAGLAAATAIKRKCPVRAIEGVELRRLLNADGARLDD